MHSRLALVSKAAVLEGCAGRPFPRKVHWPALFLPYKSTPLMPVAGIWGMANPPFVTVHRTNTDDASVANRMQIPAASWLNPHTPPGTFVLACAGRRS